MTINSEEMTKTLNNVATSIDMSGLQDTFSDVFTDFKAAGESVLGSFVGQTSGGIVGLGLEMTTLAQQAQTTLAPIVSRVTSDMPLVDELIDVISGADATKITNIQSDSDISSIFPNAQAVMTSASTMLHDIITDGTALNLGENLASVTGKTMETFAPAMEKLSDPDVQADVLKAATALRENQGVKELTNRTSTLASSFASSTGPFNSGNFLKDLVENKTYTITNSVRALNAALPESTFESITNNLLADNQVGAVNKGVGNIPVPSVIKTKAETMAIPLPKESLSSVNSFIQRMKLVAPDILTDITEYERSVRNMTNQLNQKKADVASAVKEDGLKNEQRTDTASESKQPKAFKKLRSLEEVSNLFKSIDREVTTLVVHWSGHYNDDYHIGAKEINSEYNSVGKTDAIPYHFVIKKDGTIETGANIDETTSHVSSNFRPFSVSIVFVGGFNHGRPTDGSMGTLNGGMTISQRDSLEKIIEAFYRHYPGGDVFGKRDIDEESSSPGFDVPQFVFNKFKKTNTCEPQVDKTFLTGSQIIAEKNADLIYSVRIGVQ